MWWTVQCWLPLASPLQGTAGCWVCRWRLSEAEVHWRAFLDSLIGRGLRGVVDLNWPLGLR